MKKQKADDTEYQLICAANLSEQIKKTKKEKRKMRLA